MSDVDSKNKGVGRVDASGSEGPSGSKSHKASIPKSKKDKKSDNARSNKDAPSKKDGAQSDMQFHNCARGKPWPLIHPNDASAIAYLEQKNMPFIVAGSAKAFSSHPISRYYRDLAVIGFLTKHLGAYPHDVHSLWKSLPRPYKITSYVSAGGRTNPGWFAGLARSVAKILQLNVEFDLVDDVVGAKLIVVIDNYQLTPDLVLGLSERVRVFEADVFIANQRFHDVGVFPDGQWAETAYLRYPREGGNDEIVFGFVEGDRFDHFQAEDRHPAADWLHETLTQADDGIGGFRLQRHENTGQYCTYSVHYAPSASTKLRPPSRNRRLLEWVEVREDPGMDALELLVSEFSNLGREPVLSRLQVFSRAYAARSIFASISPTSMVQINRAVQWVEQELRGDAGYRLFRLIDPDHAGLLVMQTATAIRTAERNTNARVITDAAEATRAGDVALESLVRGQPQRRARARYMGFCLVLLGIVTFLALLWGMSSVIPAALSFASSLANVCATQPGWYLAHDDWRPHWHDGGTFPCETGDFYAHSLGSRFTSAARFLVTLGSADYDYDAFSASWSELGPLSFWTALRSRFGLAHLAQICSYVMPGQGAELVVAVLEGAGEELLKRMFPMYIVGPAFLYETYALTRTPAQFAMHLAKHAVLYAMPLYAAIPLHAAHNVYLYVTHPGTFAVWDAFLRSYMEFAPPMSLAGVHPVPVTATIPCVTCPRYRTGEMQPHKAELGGTPFDIGDYDEPGTGSIWPIIVHSCLLYGPARNMTNLYACTQRLLIPRLPEVDVGWDESTFVDSMPSVPGYADVSHGVVAASLRGRPLRRFLAGWAAHARGEFSRVAKKVMMKANELLPFKSGGVTPRAIVTVDPRIVASVQPYIYPLSHALKHDITGVPFEHAGITITLVFAYGRSAEELSSLFVETQNAPGWVMWIAGDDSMIHTPDGEWIEGDFGGYDSTELAAAHRAQYAAYRKFGIPPYVIDVFETERLKPFVAGWRGRRRASPEGSIRGPYRGRVTGHADTTVGNSLVHAIAVGSALGETASAVLATRSSAALTSVLAGRYGLEFNAFYTRHPTFLKGWFVRDVWMPLPSAVIKLGKVMTDPKVMYPDVPDSLACAAKGMALSPGPIPAEYPILGPFLQALLRLSSSCAAVETPYESHRRVATTTLHTVDRDVALEMIEERYGITRIDVEALEAEYASIRDLPVLVCNPSVNRMAEVDYGHFCDA